jgi:hypothetical protein
VVSKKQGNLDDHRLNDIELSFEYNLSGLSDIGETSDRAERGGNAQGEVRRRAQ